MKCGEVTIDVLPNYNNEPTASAGNDEVQNIQSESIITDTDKLGGEGGTMRDHVWRRKSQ